MSFPALTLVFVCLIKLSIDDLNHRKVYQADLIALILASFCLFEPHVNPDWSFKVILLWAFALAVKKELMGSGDLGVICALCLILRFWELLGAIQVAGTIGALSVYRQKKAADALPFVPYLSLGVFVIYLIRLRLIFS